MRPQETMRERKQNLIKGCMLRELGLMLDGDYFAVPLYLASMR